MEGIQNIIGSGYMVSEGNSVDIIKKMIAENRLEESFYLLNVDELVRRVKMWQRKMPRVLPHYAVKCNDNAVVLRTFALLGLNFDCASKSEINKVLSCGVHASRIIYAHPCKIASHLKYAKAKSVKPMTFDCEQELYKISSLYPDAELIIRIRCDASSVQCELGIKFGVMPENARPLLALAARLKLKVTGVAFHVGSGCAEPSVFLRAIASAKQVMEEAKEEGHSPNVLDIGGGFLGGSLEHLDDAAEYINQGLDEHFPKGCGVNIIAEPGRYMVASAFTLVTPIINHKEGSVHSADVPDALQQYRASDSVSPVKNTMYYIDDGLYGSFNCVLYDHQVVSPRPLKNELTASRLSSVWGPTCDGFDQVMKAVALPPMAVGDWLVWEEMGAYTLSAAGNFNGFSAPGVQVSIHPRTLDNLQQKLERFSLKTWNSGVMSARKKVSPSGSANRNGVSARHIAALVGKLEPPMLVRGNSLTSSEDGGDSSEGGEK